MLYDKANSYDFFAIVKDLEPPGIIFESKQWKFRFGSVDKQFETYSGINVRLRYFVRLVVNKPYGSNPCINNTIKMEVGIEDCLHIEFEYDRESYHLKDVVVGKVYFFLVRIKIKHAELNVIKRETTGSGQNQTCDNETL